jgi:hypothetical protein
MVELTLVQNLTQWLGSGALNFRFYYQTKKVKVNFLHPSNRLGR